MEDSRTELHLVAGVRKLAGIPAKTVIHVPPDAPAESTGSRLSWPVDGGRRGGK